MFGATALVPPTDSSHDPFQSSAYGVFGSAHSATSGTLRHCVLNSVGTCDWNAGSEKKPEMPPPLPDHAVSEWIERFELSASVVPPEAPIHGELAGKSTFVGFGWP